MSQLRGIAQLVASFRAYRPSVSLKPQSLAASRVAGHVLPIAALCMRLSDDAALLFVLRSGVQGRLTVGKVEHDVDTLVRVYDRHGDLQPYISGTRLRSWCIVGPAGQPIPSWCSILPEDRGRLLTQAASGLDDYSR